MDWRTRSSWRVLGLTRAHALALVAVLAFVALWIEQTAQMRDEERALKLHREQLQAGLRASGDLSQPIGTSTNEHADDCEGESPFRVLDEIARQRQLVIESGLAADADRTRETPALVLQLRTRGSYSALRETLRDAAERLPCLSVDSMDLRRDKTTDPLVVADVKATLYGRARIAKAGGGSDEH